jgi:hypothetical protein
MFSAMTLVKMSREFAGDDLMNRALDGEPATVESVSELYRFVVEHFGRDTESGVSKKFWIPCGFFLANAGLGREQLQKVRRPYPIYGEPGFRSILDELKEEQPDLFDGD